MTTCTTRAAETWAHILEQPDGMSMGYAADYARDDGSEPPEACAAVEAVAQAHLDAHPDDHRARRLLGEWLQWHGDVRGEGYVFLATFVRFPFWFPADGRWYWSRLDTPPSAWAGLPECLFRWVAITTTLPVRHRDALRQYRTRRAAEDAAALAFARLPAERRAALLKGEM